MRKLRAREVWFANMKTHPEIVINVMHVLIGRSNISIGRFDCLCVRVGGGRLSKLYIIEAGV